jgi:hypothetical protein
MESIIENTPDDIREYEISMTNPSSSKYTGELRMPSPPDPKRREQRVAALIDKIDLF